MTQEAKNKVHVLRGGHYSTATDELMNQINASIEFDWHLYRQDIKGSMVHVTMLAKVGIITEDEAHDIREGLRQILGEIKDGKMEWRPELEDIHMHIEARLKELIGDVAGKLHTARSRNDQVATDFRLYVMEACDHMRDHLTALQQALLAQAEEHADTIMPGFTHLQTAQPVTFGHHMLAYIEMFERDKNRFQDAHLRMAECPLGAAALAGTSFPIDRDMTAGKLGFMAPCRNSLDAVGSRDFALEFLSACSICLTHLSRLAEELVIWSSALVGFVSITEAFTSGSSIMPQKRNPDAAELVRAKTGRVNGNLLQLLTVIKGTTLAYNKDLQEDKEPVFDSFHSLDMAIRSMEQMISGLTVHKDVMYHAASGGFSTATDLADWLVRELQIPFREAHHITGKIVKLAEESGAMLWEVPLSEMQAVDSRITESVFSVLSVEQSVASRKSYGGTAPEMVRKAIAQAKEEYVL